MRVGIVGSRRRTDRESVERLVRSLKHSDVVISGGATGPDTWAIEAADKVPLSHVEHLPRIRPGMSRGEMVEAYYARNLEIVLDCEVLYAFVARDRTGGTENTIKHAIREGMDIHIMVETEEVDETSDGAEEVDET